MKALILAGGPGTRLRPEVSDIPKPMADVADRPFLEWQLDLLEANGVTDVVISIGYEGEVIRDHFGDGSGFGVDVEYVVEDEPLGTGGAVREARPLLADEDEFLVINGDTYLDIDLSAFVAFHRDQPTVSSLALSRVTERKKGGFVDLEGDRVRQFVETEREGGIVNAGFRLFGPGVFDYMPDRTRFQLSEVFERLVDDDEVTGYLTDGYFKDIGTPERYHEINERFAEEA
ncbi:nucleotidyltransferase family protein [Haloarcula litorea]|uniref:nucleotidyltransferase family protein n=1 Tax=Haloarcula litorea TaxID=3032579 RepID=UPI0023E7FC48|nr:nucleotidyltransferase family protein [Halomicroarcula sp. GDY20]